MCTCPLQCLVKNGTVVFVEVSQVGKLPDITFAHVWRSELGNTPDMTSHITSRLSDCFPYAVHSAFTCMASDSMWLPGLCGVLACVGCLQRV